MGIYLVVTIFLMVDNEVKKRVVDIHVDKSAVWKLRLKRPQFGIDFGIE